MKTNGAIILEENPLITNQIGIYQRGIILLSYLLKGPIRIWFL